MSITSSSGIMSKQAIYSGNKVVCFLILPSKKRSYYLNSSKSNLISNEGSEVIYETVGFPIVGIYDEYEYLTNIEKTEFTDSIESYLGLTIEEFIKNLAYVNGTSLKNEKVLSVLGKLSSCMEHFEIYNQMVELDQEKRPYGESDIYYTVLESLGFKLTRKTEDERYNLMYEHPELKNIEVFSDGTFVEVMENGKKVNKIYSLSDFLGYLNLDFTESKSSIDLYYEWVKDFTKDVIKVKNVELKDSAVDEIKRLSLETDKDNTDKIMKLIDNIEKIEKSLLPKNFSYAEMKLNNEKITLLELISSNMNFVTGKEITSFSISDLVSLTNFKYAMWSTNSLFMPTYSGYDDCNPSYERDLHKIVGKFIENK